MPDFDRTVFARIALQMERHLLTLAEMCSQLPPTAPRTQPAGADAHQSAEPHEPGGKTAR
jgi:hypothetical protein